MFDVYLAVTLYSAAWAVLVIAGGSTSDALGWKPAFPHLLRIYAWLTIVPVTILVLLNADGLSLEHAISAVVMASIFVVFALLPLYGAFFHLNHVPVTGDDARILWCWAGGSVFICHLGWFVAFHLTHRPPNARSGPDDIVYWSDPLTVSLLGLYLGLWLLAVVVRPIQWRLRLHGMAAGTMLVIFASRVFLLFAERLIGKGLGIRFFFK